MLENDMFVYMALVDSTLKGPSGMWAGGDVIYEIVDAMFPGNTMALKKTRPGGVNRQPDDQMNGGGEACCKRFCTGVFRTDLGNTIGTLTVNVM